MFGKIVVAVDGSEHAARAVALAQRLASQSGDGVVLVHVTEMMVGRAAGTLQLDEDDVAVQQARDLGRRLGEAGVQVEVEIDRALVGHIAKVVVDTAAKHDAGLIVLGSRGRTDLAALLLGSVAHKVIHLSDRPVLVAR